MYRPFSLIIICMSVRNFVFSTLSYCKLSIIFRLYKKGDFYKFRINFLVFWQSFSAKSSENSLDREAKLIYSIVYSVLSFLKKEDWVREGTLGRWPGYVNFT